MQLLGLGWKVRVYSIIVCYQPNVQQLHDLCVILLLDGSKVILVDNTDPPYLADQQRPSDCQLITLGRNTGIAHAQNVGIAAAIAGGADIIAFFDQDSKIKAGFLRTLVAVLNVGAPDVVSPICFDEASNVELPSVRLDRYGVSRPVYCGDSSAPYPVDVVISSGIAATKQVFDVAGTLDEGLFIDYVDTEWCLRCRSKQISIRVVPSAVMRHSIGSKRISLGMATILVHSPPRCYYQLRNCFHLFRKRHVPILFALRETVSVFLSRMLLLLFVRDRSEYAKAYFCAMRDGIRGVAGKKPA